MPSYEYHCKACNHKFERYCKTVARRHPRKCPECGERKEFAQRLGTPIALIYGNPTTFGQQAEINEKRMGKEQIQMLKEKNDERLHSGWKGPTPQGAKSIERTTDVPFYREGLPNPSKPLDLKSVKNLDHYIRTGETT